MESVWIKCMLDQMSHAYRKLALPLSGNGSQNQVLPCIVARTQRWEWPHWKWVEISNRKLCKWTVNSPTNCTFNQDQSECNCINVNNQKHARWKWFPQTSVVATTNGNEYVIQRRWHNAAAISDQLIKLCALIEARDFLFNLIRAENIWWELTFSRALHWQ